MTPDTDKREGLGEGIYAKFVQNYEKLLEENKKLKEEIRMLKEGATLYREDNKKLREEVEQLKNKRIFNSTEYDLITLTSTTPQWELRRK